MTLKKVLFILLIMFGLVTSVIFLFHNTESPIDTDRVVSSDAEEPVHPHPTRVSTQAKPGEDRTLLHPLADPEAREAYKNQPITTWDEWVKALSEIRLGFYVEKGFTLTSDELSRDRNMFFQHYTWQAQRYQKKNHPVPKTAIELPYLEESMYYEGPQTVEAIMAAFDEGYESYFFPRAAEMEETYPRDTFLQRTLDKGAVIKDASDYVYWMKLRDMLLYRKDRPDDWRSGSYGIPVTTSFAEYEEGFIQRKVWENSIVQQVSEANEGRSVHVYFPASHPDVYLPAIGNMTYVHRDAESIDAFGASLTREQRLNLLRKGIEPEGIEIVYIDEDYNVLSEPPLVLNPHDLHVKQVSPDIKVDAVTPPDEKASVAPTPSGDMFEEDDMWRSNKTQETEATPDLKALREAVATARQTEFETFQNSMRQFAEFQNKSDAAITQALENAFVTLAQHGYEEGIRRIQLESAALAKQLERYFEEAQRPPKPQQKPQRPAPPKPPETAPPGPEAP